MPRTWSSSRPPSSSRGGGGAGFDVARLTDDRPGRATLDIRGPRAFALLADTAGGHRFQHIPAHDKRGRTHTSTVTVAVLRVPDDATGPVTPAGLNPRDLEWQATCGSGPGGQHRNKSQTAVRLTHRPSGLVVRVETERSRWQNRQIALVLLAARLAERAAGTAHQAQNTERRAQIGSGERGDKIRTIRLQDGVVSDHRSGAKWRWDDYRRGLHLPALRTPHA